MSEFITNIDDILKQALLSHVVLTLDGNSYKEGTFISFTHIFFSLNMVVKNKRKIKTDILKIPIPFEVYQKDNTIIFDYKIKKFIRNNPDLELLINDVKKPCISKFYDKILTIEVMT